MARNQAENNGKITLKSKEITLKKYFRKNVNSRQTKEKHHFSMPASLNIETVYCIHVLQSLTFISGSTCSIQGGPTSKPKQLSCQRSLLHQFVI